MASLNRVMLIGRLTDNPEPARVIPSGSTVVNFRFAVGRSKKNPQTGQWENDPNPLYIDCGVFTSPGQKRDLCNLITQYARKGSQLYLEGRLVYETWEDKNGGGKRSKHKLVVDEVQLLDRAGEGGGGGDEEMGGSRSNFGGNRSVTQQGRGPAPRQTAPANDEEFDGGGEQDPDKIPF